jgi:putative peptidoglycan lipid II flippase
LENKKEIRRSATLMSLATVISRILGFGRDMVSAHLFGAGLVSDAFMVAFRLPNFFRDLFAEGALSSAFVPALAKARHHGGDSEAWRLASLMLSAMSLILGALVLLGMLTAPWLLRFAAPGFSARPEQFELALRLTRVVFPFIGFIGMAALFMGMLNARKAFFLPALAPAMMNVAMIAFGLLICPRLGSDPKKQIMGWAAGAMVGGAAQWLIQVPAAWRGGFRWRIRWPFRDPGVKRVFKAMVPAVIGQSTTQVNLLVNTMIASKLALGSITYLNYGNRLFQMPLGIFGVAIAAAVLPDLAAYHAAGNMGGYRKTLGYGLRLTMFTDLPAFAGLVCLGLPITVLLFKGGRFTLDNAYATALVSIIYTSGVVFASWVKVLVPAYYAIDKQSVAVRVSMAMVAVNLTLNLLLWRSFGFLGLAMTTTVVSLLQALVLQFILSRYVGRLWDQEALEQVGRMIFCTALMALTLFGGMHLMDHRWPGWQEGALGKPKLALQVLGLVAAGIGVYFASSSALGLGELIPSRLWPRKAKAEAVEREVAKASQASYDEH